MDALAKISALVFEGFRLDRHGLFRRDQNGAFIPIPIGSRALDILGPRCGVSKDATMEAVWPAAAVAPNNLTVQIAALRPVLDEGRDGGSCIQTVAGCCLT